MINKVTLMCLVMLFSMSMVQADNIRGRIVKIQGQVFIINDKNERRSPAKSKFLINENETILTEENSRAVVQFTDGALSVLNEKSELRVERAGWLSQLSGKVYYIFKRYSERNPRRLEPALQLLVFVALLLL